MLRKKQQQQQGQQVLFNISQYERTITEWSIDCDGWEPKSSPVEREIVERENFQWIEQYYVKGYPYWRYCYLECDAGIQQVVKIHIPGGSPSIREGRAQMVREAYPCGNSPRQVEELIKSWST